MSCLFHRPGGLAGFTLYLLICSLQTASGFAPHYDSDRELAERPLIVVARWNDAPWHNNSLVVGNILKEYEVTTEIEVTRAIKGDVTPGKHTILVAPFVSWSVKEPRVMSYTSTQVVGDAKATTDNLWFLSKKLSRDGVNEYWYLSSYRAVQPLVLEPFFKAFQRAGIERQIHPLLRADEEIVQLRTLKLISGGDFPWPYDPQHSWESARRDKNAKPLKVDGDLLRSVIDHSSHREVRRRAAAVYCQVLDKSSVEFMRTKLDDEDPEIRAIAVGTLALHQDRVTAESFAKSVRNIDDPTVACAVIKRLAGWDNPATVAALIEFLQNDAYAGCVGNDWAVPAIKSRDALLRLTKHHFPFEVTTSREAWATAREIQDSEGRKECLARSAPCDPNPWKAVLVDEGDRVFIDVTNRSQTTLSLTARPTNIWFLRSGSSYGIGSEGVPDQPAFVSLDSGKTHRFELRKKRWDELKGIVTPRSLTGELDYMSNGNKVGVNAWLGIITIDMPSR